MPWNLTFHETRPENPRPGDCLARALAFALYLVLRGLLRLESLRPRRLAPFPKPPPADACVLCWDSLGSTGSCLMCEAHQREAKG